MTRCTRRHDADTTNLTASGRTSTPPGLGTRRCTPKNITGDEKTRRSRFLHSPSARSGTSDGWTSRHDVAMDREDAERIQNLLAGPVAVRLKPDTTYFTDCYVLTDCGAPPLEAAGGSVCKAAVVCAAVVDRSAKSGGRQHRRARSNHDRRHLPRCARRWRLVKSRAKAGLRLPADGCTGRVGGGDEWAPSGIAGQTPGRSTDRPGARYKLTIVTPSFRGSNRNLRTLEYARNRRCRAARIRPPLRP